jgi:hypothetical protein
MPSVKTLTLGLLLVIVVLAFYVIRQGSTIREQQSQINDLRKPHDPSPALENQGKCAGQARKIYADLGYKAKKFADYENHYNGKLNKCFILIRNVDASNPATIWTHKNLIDAYGGKQYGEYHWHTVKNTKYWEVPSLLCRVVLPSGQEMICKSDDEFAELMKIYMEDEAAKLPVEPSQIAPTSQPRSKLRF